MSARLLGATLIILFFQVSFSYAEFGIETDLTSIDFGTVGPGGIRGDFPSNGLTVRCTTDQGNAWFLRTHAENPLTHTENPAQVIPNENFFWYGLSTTGSGALVTNEQDFTEERVIYTAPAGEGALGVDILLQFKVSIPLYVQSGGYATTVILTMIE